MGKLLTFGEILIRFTPKNYDVFENSNELEYFFGGSEANIAATLSSLGVKTSLLSALPDNDMSKKAYRYFKSTGVEMNNIIIKGDKLGYYFVERSTGLRQSNVIYDRKHSSFSMLSLEDIDMNTIFHEVEWFHFSGITAAVSESVREVLKALVKEAKRRGIFISMDLNYRSKMWSTAEAKEFMSELAPYVDFCFGIEPIMAHEEDVNMFNRTEATKENIKQRMESLKNKYGFKYIFHTERINDFEDNNTYYAYGLGDSFEESLKITTKMVERVGSGDAFVSGVIYSIMNNSTLKESLNRGVAAATLKCTIKGDNMIASLEEIDNIIYNKNSINR